MQNKKIIKFFTGENEILIYTKNGDEYRNLIIDEDSIEFLYVAIDRENTYNEIYYSPYDIKKLVEKL